MAKLLTYEQKDTWMDRLCGVTKLIYFLACVHHKHAYL